VEWLRTLQASLDEPLMDDESLRATLQRNFEMLENFARGWQAQASKRYPEIATFVNAAAGTGPLDFSELLLAPAAVARQAAPVR
jgi:hypothetical protein